MATAPTTEAPRPVGGVRGAAREVVQRVREIPIIQRAENAVSQWRAAWQSSPDRGTFSVFRALHVRTVAVAAEATPKQQIDALADGGNTAGMTTHEGSSGQAPTVESGTTPVTPPVAGEHASAPAVPTHPSASPSSPDAGSAPAAPTERTASPATQPATEPKPAGGPNEREAQPAAKPAEAAPQSGPEAPNPAADATPATAPAQPGQKPPESQPAVAESIPSVADMEKRLQTGMNIGGVTIRIDADHPTSASAFAQGLEDFIASRGDTLYLEDQALIRYMINTAQVAGVSKDQLRAELDDWYPREPVKNPDTGEVTDAGNTGRDPKILGVLGLPEKKPTDPQPATKEQREAAQKARRAAMADIIKDNRGEKGAKLPAEKLLPKEDIEEAAAEILGGMAKQFPKDADTLQNILHGCSTEDLASIVASPERFVNNKDGLRVARLVAEKIKYHTGIARRFGKKRWRQMTAEERAQALAQEQFAALTLSGDKLKQMEKEYKKAKSLLVTILLLGLSIAASTFYQVAADELGQVSNGQI